MSKLNYTVQKRITELTCDGYSDKEDKKYSKVNIGNETVVRFEKVRIQDSFASIDLKSKKINFGCQGISIEKLANAIFQLKHEQECFEERTGFIEKSRSGKQELFNEKDVKLWDLIEESEKYYIARRRNSDVKAISKEDYVQEKVKVEINVLTFKPGRSPQSWGENEKRPWIFFGHQAVMSDTPENREKLVQKLQYLLDVFDTIIELKEQK